jgi:hypothetical protein
MKRAWWIILVALVVVVLGVTFFTRPGHAPIGQPELMNVSAATLAAMQAEFNRSSDKLRVILLLSPT